MSAQLAIRILARELPFYASPFGVPLLLPLLYFRLQSLRAADTLSSVDCTPSVRQGK